MTSCRLTLAGQTDQLVQLPEKVRVNRRPNQGGKGFLPTRRATSLVCHANPLCVAASLI